MAKRISDAEWRGDLPTRSETAQQWKGQNFKFRAVGGKNMVVLVYGSNVDLVAIGKGTVKLAGLPDVGVGDGNLAPESFHLLMICANFRRASRFFPNP